MYQRCHIGFCDSNIQGVVASNVIESTTVDQETRIVAAANLSSAGQLGAPVFYSAREGSGFSYNLNDIIVEKFDSAGELIGFYVYPDATSTDRVYKDFIYTNTVSDTQHLIVNGSDAGGSLYITDANIFHGGLGDDLVTSVDDPTRIMHGLHQGVAISGGGGNDTLRGYWGTIYWQEERGGIYWKAGMVRIHMLLTLIQVRI